MKKPESHPDRDNKGETFPLNLSKGLPAFLNGKDPLGTLLKYPTLSKKEMQDLFIALGDSSGEKGEAIKGRLIMGNLKLVASAVISKGVLPSSFKSNINSEIFDDAFSNGLIGLIEAINEYDLSKGVEFSSFAKWKIQSKVNSTITSETNIIKLPPDVIISSGRLKQKEIEFSDEFERDPTEEELASYAEISLAKLHKLQRYASRVESLDSPSFLSGEGNSLRGDSVAAEAINDPRYFMMGFGDKQIEEMMNECLDQKEKDVITRYFEIGASKGKKETLKAIAESYGVSPERIRQIKEEALVKLGKEVERNR